jgi:hypothetical protein
MHCLRSLGSRDRGFESHSGHGCLVFVCVCAFFCVCVQVEALRRADHPPKESYRSETESFMEVGQGPNWGCNAKGKKKSFFLYYSVSSIHSIFTFVDLVHKLRLFQRTWQLINHKSVWIMNFLCKQNKCREALLLNKHRNNYLSSDPSVIQGWLYFTSTVKLAEQTGNLFYAVQFSPQVSTWP